MILLEREVLGECDGEILYGDQRLVTNGRWDEVLSNEAGDPIWKPRDEDAYRYIGEFTPSHRRHLFEYLCRSAASIEFRDAVGQISGWLFAARGDQAMQAEDEWYEWRGTHQLEWLLGRPFMRALAALLVGDGNTVFVAHWEREAGLHPPLPIIFEEF